MEPANADAQDQPAPARVVLPHQPPPPERRLAPRAPRHHAPPAERRPLPGWAGPLVAIALGAVVLVVAGTVPALVTALVAVVVAQTADLVRLRRRASTLDRLARTDDLTALGNARALWEDLNRLLVEGALALAIFDLDRFKDVNDGYGHAVGDAVLRETGRAIRTVTGDAGSAYRYGGEEFVVLLAGAGEQPAAELAERIRLLVGEHREGLPNVTISAGVAAAGAGADGNILLDRADRGLRRAKATGRDRVVRASVVESLL